MTDAIDFLQHIDPTLLDYQQWCNVGMALKHEGCTPADWDQWSQRDSKRYRSGECERKWAGFNGSAAPVTGGTLYELARQHGWRPEPKAEGQAFGWDSVIGGKDYRVVDPGWVEDADVAAPSNWNPAQDLIRYLSALFSAEDHVGYVCQSWQKEDQHLPKEGCWDRKAGELIAELSKYQDIGKALGDWNPEAGAWIRFNPLDGQGIKDLNVTAYRYALIESDAIPVEQQATIYRELELPVAALVHSGKKSLHAIVRVEATSKEEYRERVNFLHEVCNKNGLKVDTQNKNPSRLSRMPGATRNGQPQFLLGTNQGKASWQEWRDWIEEVNDNLPDIEFLADVFGNLPPLSPPLIDGLLREGHKMLLAGPSKAGKSYILLQLAMAIAEGQDWMGWTCAQGKVLYVNLELDRASCLHRLANLYKAKGWFAKSVSNIHIWNLRGKAVPMDKLAPKLIRRAQKHGYKAVIIDPIYKVLTGDENSADQMALFCNQFDRVCAELGAATIYCHHHSKGAQGQKSARDRSSGSGVFARDPDAIIDLIELRIESAQREVLENRIVCPVITDVLDANVPDWQDQIGQDTAIVAKHFLPEALKLLDDPLCLSGKVDAARKLTGNISGWRIEGTLREFPPIPPRQVFFQYPVHLTDDNNLLGDSKAEGEEAPWAAAQRERAEAGKGARQSQKDELVSAHSCLSTFGDEPVLLGDLADHLGKTVATTKKRIGQIKDLVIGEDDVVRTKVQHERYLLKSAIDSARQLDGTIKVADVSKALKKSESSVRRWLAGHEDTWELRNGCVLEIEEAQT